MGLGDLFGKKKKEVAKAPSVSSGVEQTILGVVGAKAIPTMPNAAQRAFELSTNPAAEARDFVEVIASDESLSGRVVKIANSVFYDRGKHPQTIEEAVLVIGLNELRCLLNATTLSEIFASNNPLRATLWTHDIAVALAAKALARRVMPGMEDTAFLAGLMHDIGKLLLVQRLGPEYQKVISIVQDTGCDYTEAEERSFPFTHVEVGLLIGQRWRFTPEMMTAIGEHHQIGTEVNFGTLVGAADMICHALGLGDPPGLSRLQQRCSELAPERLAILGIPAGEYRSISDNIKKSFEFERDLYLEKQGDRRGAG